MPHRYRAPKLCRPRLAPSWAALALGIVVGCAPSDRASGGSNPGGPHPTGSDGGGGGDFSDPNPSTELCNGFDDDQDGLVDEDCPCDDGDTQPCFTGDPNKLGVGPCTAGTQTCALSGTGEFGAGVWGECVGAVGPTIEICGDGVDSDCSGADTPCDGSGGNGSGGADGSGGAPDGSGGAPDGGGGGGPGDVVDVDLFLFGDCITASCPSDHPYPVGCNVIFSPGDDRGCIASMPANSVVYLQAGDQCNQGLIAGTLQCSTTIGQPLSASNCPINKPIPIYATDPSGCPETH